MIQAIVFLPLIGALIAGAVTLYGAHARNPGGDEPASPNQPGIPDLLRRRSQLGRHDNTTKRLESL